MDVEGDGLRVNTFHVSICASALTREGSKTWVALWSHVLAPPAPSSFLKCARSLLSLSPSFQVRLEGGLV